MVFSLIISSGSHNRGACSKLTEYYTAEVAALVTEWAHDDLVMFGYPPWTPSAETPYPAPSAEYQYNKVVGYQLHNINKATDEDHVERSTFRARTWSEIIVRLALRVMRQG